MSHEEAIANALEEEALTPITSSSPYAPSINPLNRSAKRAADAPIAK